MVVVVIKRLQDAHEMHHRPHYHQDMEELVRGTINAKPARPAALGKPGLFIIP